MSTPAMRRYTVGVVICAVALALLLASSHAVNSWPTVLVLMALTFVTESFALPLPIAGSVSLSSAMTFAAVLHSGPLAAILCALSASASLREYREGKPVGIMIFNAGQLTLSAGLAGLAYGAAGGPLLGGAGNVSVNFVAAALPPIVFFSVNMLLVSYAVSLVTDQRLWDVLGGQGFLSHGFSLLVLALLGLVVASLLAASSWLGLALLVLPFMAARRTFKVYAELSEAYTSTVRSLVTAIEAKDPYTKGHSERVAVYARGLAACLRMSKSESELVERAALLHDVGKIGIPLDTLTSPAQLSPEEVRLIRQHPDVGSRLVSDVEFLCDIVPVIRHHHERVDGAGYPDGLIGEDIPPLSRLLAVADAYDAMTSTRAYRLAMSTEAAIAELQRVSGLQLDAHITAVFIEMLRTNSYGVSVDA